MDLTQQANARSIVAMWRTGGHAHAWDGPGKTMLPSEVQQAAADAAHRLAIEADVQADILRIQYGYQPGHETIRHLRQTAREFATRSNRLNAWAQTLRDAEQDT